MYACSDLYMSTDKPLKTACRRLKRGDKVSDIYRAYVYIVERGTTFDAEGLAESAEQFEKACKEYCLHWFKSDCIVRSVYKA